MQSETSVPQLLNVSHAPDADRASLAVPDGAPALTDLRFSPPAAPVASPQTALPHRPIAQGRSIAWPRVAGWSLLALLVAVVAASYGAYASWARGGRIAPGVFAQGENLSGLTPAQARQRLNARFGRLFVTVQTPERAYKLALRQLGGQPQINSAVKNAYWYGRSGHVARNIWRMLGPAKDEQRLALPVRWDKARLRRTMWTVAAGYNQAPRDAALEVTDDGVQVVAEQSGRALNVGETLKQLQKRYYVGRPTVEATVRETRPRITAASLAGSDVELGRYMTRFDAGLWGRTRNIRVASGAVNGTVLMPGELLSFNKLTGERTWDKGYRMAHIFERKPGKSEAEVVDGLAGGVCQVSSTLFNAVRKTNNKTGRHLKIVERNYHSLPVTYVPTGLDATVAWSGKDFKFRNTFAHPVYLRAAVSGSRLTISVWGRVPQNPDAITIAAPGTSENPAHSGSG